MTSILTHLAQYLFPILPPQNDGYHSQQQKDDAHQAANQNSCITAVILGYRKPRPWSVCTKFWIYKRKTQEEMFGVCTGICLNVWNPAVMLCVEISMQHCLLLCVFACVWLHGGMCAYVQTESHTHTLQHSFIRITKHLMGIVCVSMHSVCPLIPQGFSEPAAMRIECEHCFASQQLCIQLLIWIPQLFFLLLRSDVACYLN